MLFRGLYSYFMKDMQMTSVYISGSSVHHPSKVLVTIGGIQKVYSFMYMKILMISTSCFRLKSTSNGNHMYLLVFTVHKERPTRLILLF